MKRASEEPKLSIPIDLVGALSILSVWSAWQFLPKGYQEALVIIGIGIIHWAFFELGGPKRGV